MKTLVINATYRGPDVPIPDYFTPEEWSDPGIEKRIIIHARPAPLKVTLVRTRDPAPPREMRTKDDVIDEWFQTCVARYDGAWAEARDLFDGFQGKTLKRFASQSAPKGLIITQADMERYLDRRKIPSRRVLFVKRYVGICPIINGNVRSGNYAT